MYYNEDYIVIHNRKITFKYNVRKVIEHKNNFIILLSIPFDKNELNNIYCVNTKGILLWQVQDIIKKFPSMKNLSAYEQIGIKDNILYASDFFGRKFMIDITNGNIIDCIIVK